MVVVLKEGREVVEDKVVLLELEVDGTVRRRIGENGILLGVAEVDVLKGRVERMESVTTVVVVLAVEDEDDKEDIATTLFWNVKKISGESDEEVIVDESADEVSEVLVSVSALEGRDVLVSEGSNEEVTIEEPMLTVLETVES